MLYHLAHLEGCASLRIVLVTVPRVSRSCEAQISMVLEPFLGIHLYARLSGPEDPSFRALSGRLKLTVRRHKFNKDSLSVSQ